MNDDSTVSTNEFSGTLSCSSSISLAAPTLAPPSAPVYLGTPYEYEFGAFLLSGDIRCGWNELYSVSTDPAADLSKITYPATATDVATCNSYELCRKIQIDTSSKG